MIPCFARLRTPVVSVAALGLVAVLTGAGYQAAQALGYDEITIADRDLGFPLAPGRRAGNCRRGRLPA